MQCPKCITNTSVSTTVQLEKTVKRYRKCKACGNNFITIESIIEPTPAKSTPVPDAKGLYTPEDAVSLKMQKAITRRKNEDRVSSYYIEDDYE
jgi:transcriptional regulator NrdR family protein